MNIGQLQADLGNIVFELAYIGDKPYDQELFIITGNAKWRIDAVRVINLFGTNEVVLDVSWEGADY